MEGVNVRASDADAERSVARELRVVVVLALLGALAALPVVRAGASLRADPTVLLVWLSMLAPAAGCACAALGVRCLPFGVTVPAAWALLIALVDAFAVRGLPTPAWAVLVLSGLFLAGHAMGRFAASAAASTAALLLVAALLVALPGHAGVSWSPRAASLLLDCSPATLVCESAGLDWMRHPSVYDPAGTDRFQREPFAGELAGPLAVVLGCAAALLAARARRAVSR
jgi:hypothetical protein